MEGFAGALLGALLGSIGTYFTIRFNYHHLYAETVSQSRNKWLNEMRENISIMLAEARRFPRSDKYFTARNQVLLRLNTSEKLHALLKEQIQMLDDCDCKTLSAIEPLIIQNASLILKPEWERVKKEAKGEKNG